jgi:DNA-binding NarL/FixJ family response regulator
VTDEKKENQTSSSNRGRRKFQPTYEQRQQVVQAAKAGQPHKDIAARVGVSLSTLRKRFAEELASVGGLFDATGKPKPKRRSKSTATATKAGRSEFQPTEHHRERVRVLKAAGSTNQEICEAIGVSEPTLTKHFVEDLRLGRAKTKADMILAMHRKAKTGSVPAQRAMLDQIEAADIADAEKAMSTIRNEQPEVEPDATPAKGKKELAELEAQTIDDDGWNGLIQ